MPQDADRRAELLAAAAVDDVREDERAELDALLADDPSAAPELAALRQVAAELPPAGSGWHDAPLPAGLREAVLGQTVGTPQLGRPRTATAGRRPTSLLGAAAAGLVVAGAGGALAVEALVGRPPDGPPGTLGAVEALDVQGQPEGVDAEVAVVAHTWGTETVLDIDGLPVGQAYSVVLVDSGGAEAGSGSFLGSELAVECRVNAALLREDVQRVEIRDDAGTVVMASVLPPASA